jgi:hypothetical protein
VDFDSPTLQTEGVKMETPAAASMIDVAEEYPGKEFIDLVRAGFRMLPESYSRTWTLPDDFTIAASAIHKLLNESDEKRVAYVERL